MSEEGKAGYGIALMIKRKFAAYMRLWRTSRGDGFESLWVMCRGSVFGVQGSVLIGCAYVNPLTSSRDAQAIQDAYVALNVQVGEASAVTPHICLMGDFNAHLGELNEGEGHALQHRPAT
jgi:hypothetical protein